MSLPKVELPIKIDGVLDDEAWHQAKTLTLDYQIRPGENVAPSASTQVWILENNNMLYIAFAANDPEPDTIRAAYRDQDKGWSDDFVGVVLDTFGEARRSYMFYANALGAQMDLVYDGVSNRGNSAWDGLWQSAGKLTDQGYVVEMAIPLKVMQFVASSGKQSWGVNFIRNRPRSILERISYIPLDRENPCYLCQLPKLEGFDNASPGRSLDVIPYAVTGNSQTLDTERGETEALSNTEIGGDIRWGITPSTSLYMTINPDFSQVSVDGAQLDVNNNFTLFYPELRPFFLDNADYFENFMRLVYTRNIATPNWGAKITSKLGNNTGGIIITDDDTTSFIVPDFDGSTVTTLDEKSINAVLRYRRDYGDNSFAGIVSTLRQSDDYHNYLISVDGKHRLADNHSVFYQVALSETRDAFDYALLSERYGEENDKDGFAYRALYLYQSRDWLMYANSEEYDEDFRADMGFVEKVNFAKQALGGARTWYAKPNKWWNEVRLQGGGERQSRGDGLSLKESYYAFINVKGDLQSSLRLGANSGSEYYQGDTFDISDINLSAEFRPHTTSKVKLAVSGGNKIDYDNNRSGSNLRFQPRINFEYGKHLQMDVGMDFQRMDVTGGTLFKAQALDARMIYQLSNRTQFSISFQKINTSRNLDLYRNPQDFNAQSKDINRQILYSYKVSPQTVVYAGYNDVGFTNDEFRQLHRSFRSVFLKVSYGLSL
ncbi:carbohydrate binding family 9 domain-containing protein [Thalassotalea sp. LPB0316]|uniref:carbohydrate binding family 9 domain-containing protein n=1 Tax=Thalassotalea sp. LPB0316 TaxID=2769490 RepID=UPI001868591B|nr:carbohydrate binding family 9 domain-containing protein [Thalassotalea sp. LPB0316]QOL24652.1 carbohydrate binding family 9 domain-containing protein [Thalassotalea sp. LPB0316]